MAHTLQTALSSDSMVNTHPISVPVNNPSQITEIFDSISYDKVRPPAKSLSANTKSCLEIERYPTFRNVARLARQWNLSCKSTKRRAVGI